MWRFFASLGVKHMSTNISIWERCPGHENKCITLGYARHTKEYRILMSQLPVHTVETMYVTFAKDIVNYELRLKFWIYFFAYCKDRGSLTLIIIQTQMRYLPHFSHSKLYDTIVALSQKILSQLNGIPTLRVNINLLPSIQLRMFAARMRLDWLKLLAPKLLP